jgi:hypothetical protein
MTEKPASLRGRGASILLPQQGNPFPDPLEPSPLAPYLDPSRVAPAPTNSVTASSPRFAGGNVAEDTAAGAKVAAVPPPSETGAAAEQAARYPSAAEARNQLPNLPDPTEWRTTPDPVGGVAPATKGVLPNDGFGDPLDPNGQPIFGGQPFSGAGSGPTGVPPILPVNPAPPDPLQLPIADLPENDRYLRLFVNETSLRKLWGQIDTLEKLVLRDRTGNQKDIDEHIRKLKAARNRILAGPQHFEDAERLVAEVEANMSYRARMRRWSYSWGILLALASLIWLVLTVGGIFTIFVLPFPTDPVPGLSLQMLCFAVLCGMLGGVTSSLRSLILHIAIEQNFDPQQSIWYLFSPLLGGMLSVLVFFVYMVGGVIFAPAGVAPNSDPGVLAWIVVGALSFVTGFQQNTAYQLVERLMRLVFGESSSKRST